MASSQAAIKERLFQALLEGSGAVSAARSLSEALKGVLAPAASVLGAESARAWTVGEGGRLRTVAAGESQDAGLEGAAARAFADGRAVFEGDALAFPVMANGKAIAVLGFRKSGGLGQEPGASKVLDCLGAQLALHSRHLELKSRFLSGVSHELRTPMNAILGMSGLLLTAPLGAQEREYARSVYDAAETLLCVINDLLDASKIESGRLLLEVQDFDLAETVEASLELSRPQAQAKGLKLELQLSDGLPRRVTGDPGRLRQVLTSLAANGVQFTASGSIVVRAEPTPEGLLFSVTDTGEGIARDLQAGAFEPFVRVHSDESHSTGGVGLGLSICRDLVRLMGGRIGLESEIGKGTRVWFVLPLPPTSAEAIGGLQADLSKVRLLVVADRAPVRGNLKRQCSAWVLETEEADGQDGALRLAGERSAKGRAFSLVIVDHSAAGIDGFSFARALRADARTSGVRILISSSSPVREEEWRSAGAAGAILQPIRQGDLFETLNRVAASPLPAAPLSAPAADAEPPRESRLRVLVVDDASSNRMLATALLKKLGFTADTAADGREATEAVARHPYGLVLMDVMMPVMSGLEAASEIRRMESGRTRVPIVAMTAASSEDDRARAAEAGMDGFLAKPVRSADLRTVLARWTAALDPAQSGDMKAELGAEAWAELLQAYRKTLAEGLLELKAAGERGDVEAAKARAHALKGASGNMGASMLQRLLGWVEWRARQGSCLVGAAWPAIEDEAARALSALDGA